MFQLRQRVHARLNGVFRLAVVEEIVDSSESSSSADGVTEAKYYVHWLDQDRRLDAWVAAADLRALAVGTSRQAAAMLAAPKVTTGIATRAMAARDVTTTPSSLPKSKAMEVAMRPPEPTRHQDSKFFSRAKNVRWFFIGADQIEPWYFTPYSHANPLIRAAMDECAAACAISAGADMRVSSSPSTPASVPCRASELTISICPFCLAPFQEMSLLVERHLRDGPQVCARRPPGREIYRDTTDGIIIFEIDGAVHRAFCERIALLSKAFLEHKSLDYDTSPFVFFVLCLVTPQGCKVAAYFSREKRNPTEKFNLSCILTLPHHQGRGFGRFLVEMSYEMSRREGRVGSPEKPLSDLGEKTYMSYWREAVVDALLPQSALEGRPVQLEQLMHITGMTLADVTAALRSLKLLDSRSATDAVLHLTPEVVASHLEAKTRRTQRGDVRFEPTFLCYRPSDYDLVPMTRHHFSSALRPTLANAVDPSRASPGDKRLRGR